MPHLLLSEHKAQEGAGHDGQGRADHGTTQGDHGSIPQTLQLEDGLVILQVETLGEPVDITSRTRIIVGDAVDDQVVEGICTDEGEEDEESDVKNIVDLLPF